MAINIDELNFSSKSMIPIIGSAWDVSGGSIVSQVLTLSPDGYATCECEQTIISSTFQYCKLVVEFESSVINTSSNFKSTPRILIGEIYINDNNVVSFVNKRCILFNTFEPKGDDSWVDTTVYPTLNKPMRTMSIKIINDTDSELVIKNIYAYNSIDVSRSQVDSAIQQVQAAGEPSGFKVYTDEEYEYINGLSVTLSGSSQELKYKPVYVANKLARIDTNFGKSYPVVYVPEIMSL